MGDRGEGREGPRSPPTRHSQPGAPRCSGYSQVGRPAHCSPLTERGRAPIRSPLPPQPTWAASPRPTSTATMRSEVCPAAARVPDPRWPRCSCASSPPRRMAPESPIDPPPQSPRRWRRSPARCATSRRDGQARALSGRRSGGPDAGPMAHRCRCAVTPQDSMTQKVADHVLSVAIPVHMHISTNAVVTDYVPKNIRSRWPPLCSEHEAAGFLRSAGRPCSGGPAPLPTPPCLRKPEGGRPSHHAAASLPPVPCSAGAGRGGADDGRHLPGHHEGQPCWARAHTDHQVALVSTWQEGRPPEGSACRLPSGSGVLAGRSASSGRRPRWVLGRRRWRAAAPAAVY